MLFEDGGAFVWRNGDTVTPTGSKCVLEAGGSPVGDPKPADVETTTWNYVW